MRRFLLFAFVYACNSSSSDAPARVDPPTKPTAAQQASADTLLTGPDWYRHAVFYEVFVRSYQDSNGDGIGDLQGLIARLDYIKDLGADALWLMPMYPTPFKDSGYDISDYRGINPEYGTMADFDQLVAEAHKRKMRVFIDLVLNHTSDQHAWFQESKASKTNPKASWYVWSDIPSRADLGTCGSAGTRFGEPWTLDAPRNQYFFHRFYKEQPELDYRNPEVVAATLDMVKFWITDKNVDGYRADVIGQLFESPAGCNMIPETLDYIRKLRTALDGQTEKAMVAESSDFSTSSAYFGNGHDMFHMAFDFGFGYFWGLAFGSQNKQIVENAIKTTMTYPAGAQPAQVIGSHDVPRAWLVSGSSEWRYRNAAMLSMTLRGTPFIYYGEEVGIRPGEQRIVDERDAERTPMTWTGAGNGHGFTTGKPWIAFGPDTEITGVDAQDASSTSMLHFYRQLLSFRRGHAVWGTGDVELVSLDTSQIVSFIRKNDQETYLVAVNMSEDDASGSADNVPGTGTLVFGEGSISGKTVKLPGKSAAVFQVR